MAASVLKSIESEAPSPLIDLSLQQRLRRAEVASIMTKGVICVTTKWTIRELSAVLTNGDLGGVPVVDDAWRPIGIVSKSDVVRYLSEHGTVDDATVADCMLPLAITAHPAMPIAQVAALMAWEGIHRLPISGPAGDVIGIVSTLDIARWVAKTAGYAM